jgi:FixJ family two-component response regulator
MSRWASDGVVFIVDDEADVRESLSALVSAMGLKYQQFESGEQFIEFLETWRAGIAVAVVDVRMKGMSGLAVLQRIRGMYTTLPCIIVTAYADFTMAVDAMAGEAFTVLCKPYRDQELWERIVQALEKSEQAYDDYCEVGAISNRFATLSPSEIAVMNFLIRGVTNKKISHLCEISPRTVDLRRKAILDKMNVASVPDLIWKLARMGYSPTEQPVNSFVAGDDDE